jgi:hypothetical protein
MMPDEPVTGSRNRPGLDGDGMPSAEDLFDPRPAASPADIRNEMLSQMGHDVPRAPRPPDHPDVHGIAEQLGLA